jgi:UDP-3-O-[3-hydroxymyristoyl] glucosamine N-acyltransferase LpxD
MGDRLISTKEISKFLVAELIGTDVQVIGLNSADCVKAQQLSFISKNSFRENETIQAVYLVKKNKKINKDAKAIYIKVANPRLAFAKVAQEYFPIRDKRSISKKANIHIAATLGANVHVGDFTIIGENAVIEDNVVIENHVVITKDVVIGESSHIKSGAIIGEEGFGFDFEADKTPVRLPHYGSVCVGERVEVGAKSTIARGTLGQTIICDDVKIDDQVHIAHNCFIGEKTIITACVEISGSVKIGKRCWLGPNCSVINKVIIGDDVTVGIGATVTESISSGKTVMGIKAMALRKLVSVIKLLGI